MKLGKNAPRGLIILTKFRDYREKIMTFLLIPIPNFGIVAFFLVHTLGLSMTIGKEMTSTKVLKPTSLLSILLNVSHCQKLYITDLA